MDSFLGRQTACLDLGRANLHALIGQELDEAVVRCNQDRIGGRYAPQQIVKDASEILISVPKHCSPDPSVDGGQRVGARVPQLVADRIDQHVEWGRIAVLEPHPPARLCGLCFRNEAQAAHVLPGQPKASCR